MSVLMNFAIFPTDLGESKSKEVSTVIEMIKNSGVSYKLNSMGTTVETKTMQAALQILQKSYEVLAENHSRIYSTVTFDIRKNHSNRIEEKVNSIEKLIGKVNK
jgi:uncharacterized protein (TIGR00106 family)